MKIKFFCPRWGSESIPWDTFCFQVKEAGFDGVESSLPFDKKEAIEILRILQFYDLQFIGQYYQSFESDFGLHKQQFIKYLDNLIEAKPVLIDSQTGKDYFTQNQNVELFRIAHRVSQQSGVPIAHETHRNKALFAAHITKQLLETNPDIRITADFSHWCNVSESLLEQQDDALTQAIIRTIHIHARVGHSQSPQVSDPRAPEWKQELEAHLGWWDRIVKFRTQAGAELLTITPEFGPFPYMPCLPFKKKPVANQWDINVHMMHLLKERYHMHCT
jgi:sugar phosphate isomerase/epimerase